MDNSLGYCSEASNPQTFQQKLNRGFFVVDQQQKGSMETSYEQASWHIFPYVLF